MIAVIDYDAGNIKSVEHALIHLGADAVLTRDPSVIEKADGVILPGVGAFKDAMDNLNKYGLVEVIRSVCQKGTPFLGICLGLQLLFEDSAESPGIEGLSILKGHILRIKEEPNLKIPHIGWNDLSFPKGKESTLFEGLPDEAYVYFVHSYYLSAEEDIVTATASYGSTLIHASIQKENVYACQFHPEKSSEVGMTILKNFLRRAQG